jgi:hypothetical protein
VAGRIRSVEKSNDLIVNRIRDLPACSIVPQPTTLQRYVDPVIFHVHFTLLSNRLVIICAGCSWIFPE